jgi:hypothetical protein
MSDHEHRFVEEREPSGRLILGPCLVCGMSALDAMDALRQERDDLLDLPQGGDGPAAGSPLFGATPDPAHSPDKEED